MRYNKSEIMKEAWRLYKSCTPAFRAPFARYLILSWSKAKKEAEKAQRIANRTAFDRFATISIFGKEVDFRLWENYGKRRIYCSMAHGAYIDLNNGAEIVASGSAKEACEKFLETYMVA